jgi:hypothetical protein
MKSGTNLATALDYDKLEIIHIENSGWKGSLDSLRNQP